LAVYHKDTHCVVDSIRNNIKKVAAIGFEPTAKKKINRDVVLVLGVKFARLEINTVLYSGH